MILRNGKVQYIKKFFKQIFEVSIKIFCSKWEGETLPKWFFIYKQLDKYQNEYYPDNENKIFVDVFPSMF